MNVYHLERQEQCHREENAAVVVIAGNEDEARSRAADLCGAEGPTAWLERASVDLIGTAVPDINAWFACVDCLEA